MIMKMINSVLGFDFDLELIDRDGELVTTGIKSTCYPETEELPNIGSNFGNTRWFTHFDDRLLQKIRDYKRLNT
jgi:hypothetical protein